MFIPFRSQTSNAHWFQLTKMNISILASALLPSTVRAHGGLYGTTTELVKERGAGGVVK